MLLSKQKLKIHFIFLFGWFLVLFLGACSPKTYQIYKIEGKQIAIDSTLPSNKYVESFVAPYRLEMEKELETKLTYAASTFSKDRSDPETTLGNFIADLCFDMALPKFKDLSRNDLDFALLNAGGLRAEINKGDVKLKNAFEVMPFENKLVVVQLSHPKFLELLDYYVRAKDAHPISKQLRLVIDGDKLEKYSIQGKENAMMRSYFVLTNDYLANGGDHMDFFLSPISYKALDYSVRDAIIDGLKTMDSISPYLDQRVIRK